MSGFDELDRGIQERLAKSEAKRRLHQDHLHQQMDDTDQRNVRFRAAAERVMNGIIRPRVERLARHFDNAEVLDAAQGEGDHCVCTFWHTDRFPATAFLDLFVGADDSVGNFLLAYSLEIRPVFFHFEKQDQLSMPLDQIDETRILKWVNQKLVAFVDTYLRLEEAEPYQGENMVTDPVCGMRIQQDHRGWRSRASRQDVLLLRGRLPAEVRRRSRTLRLGDWLRVRAPSSRWCLVRAREFVEAFHGE